MSKKKDTRSVTAAQPSSELTLEDKVNHIFNMVNKIDSSLSEQQVRVTKLETDMVDLTKEVHILKNIVNSHEQERRSTTIRITGFPLTEEEKGARSSEDLKKRVFERLLGPILNVAYDNGLTVTRPTISNTIVSCYRIGAAAAQANTSPPPLVVKLYSSEVRIHILLSKREAAITPSAAEKEAGSKAFFISEDLTQPAFKKLKELKDHPDVEKAWSYEGRLQFVLVGSKFINKVSSVFDDVNTIVGNAKS